MLSSQTKAVILTPVRLLGDGLAQSLNRRPEITVEVVATDLFELRRTLSAVAADVVLVDVTQEVNFEALRMIAAKRTNLALVALGLPEQRRDVMRRGRTFFDGFVPRDASVDELRDAMVNAVASRLACPAEISSGMLQRCLTWMRHPFTRGKKGH